MITFLMAWTLKTFNNEFWLFNFLQKCANFLTSYKKAESTSLKDYIPHNSKKEKRLKKPTEMKSLKTFPQDLIFMF